MVKCIKFCGFGVKSNYFQVKNSFFGLLNILKFYRKIYINLCNIYIVLICEKIYNVSTRKNIVKYCIFYRLTKAKKWKGDVMKILNSKRILAILLSVLVVAELVVSVVLSTVATGTDTKTEVKQLIDFTNCEVAEEIEDSAWPAGIAKMTNEDTFAYDSNATVDIAEDDGAKFLKFNFDKNKTTSNSDYIADRGGHKFYVKVSVPVNYLPYLKDFKVDMLYSYKQQSGNTTDKKKQAYYVLGVKDGDVFGKDNRTHYSIAPTNAVATDESKTVAFSNIKKLTESSSIETFLKQTSNYESASTWDTYLEDANNVEILVMFSAPDVPAALRNRGYFFGIKGVSVTLEGPTDKIEDIDKPAQIDPTVVNFEEGATLTEITDATGFTPQGRGELVTEGAHSGTNAYLYRRKMGTTGTDYDTRVGVKIDKKKSPYGKGLTFMVKNISEVKVTFRLWIAAASADSSTDDGKIGKYHYTFSVQPGMTEYQRVTIYWDNVGLTDYTHGGFSGGTSSGNAIPQAEINSGFNIKILQSGLSIDDEGVLFDTFELVTDEFIADRKISLVDFENCDVGSDDLPVGVSITGDYKGKNEIVDNSGKKALRVNYDVPGKTKTESSGQWHQLINRYTFEYKVNVPTSILKDVEQIVYKVNTNAPDHSSDKGTNTYYQTILHGDNISFKGAEGAKVYDQARNSQVNISFDPNGSSTYGYTASHYAYNYFDKKNSVAMTEEYLTGITTVCLYVAVPVCDGDEGYWFDLEDIVLEFAEPPVTYETVLRDIFTANSVEAVTGSTLTVTEKYMSITDPNSAEFDKAYVLSAQAGNTEGALFKNDLIAYKRNVKLFTETAVFHLFVDTAEETELEATFTDAAGETLVHKFTAPVSTTKLYADISIPFKDIYAAYKTANPDGLFSLRDIRSISIRPASDEACEITIAYPQILTGEFLNSENNPEKLKKVNLINFDNMNTVEELPLGLNVNNGIGTLELVKKEDGSKALRIHYDEKCEINRKIAYGQVHQIVNRSINSFTITVPSGSLKGLKKINYTVNANVPEFREDVKGENTTYRYANTYYQTVVQGNGAYFKAHESALKYTQKIGEENVVTFDLYGKETVGGTSASGMSNHLSKTGALKVDETYTEGFTTIYITIGYPECTGDEGYWFELSSIDLEFESEPLYQEVDETRTIIEADRYEKPSSDSITVTPGKLESNDKNYRKFKTFYTIDAKKGNTEPVLFKNGNINFLRQAKTFLDTATFRVYAHSGEETTAKFALVNFNGERLPFEINLKKTVDAVYDEYTVSLKEIYEKFLATGSGKFSLYKLVGVEVLPDSSKDVQFKVAEIGLWTKEAGSGSSAGNYYYANDDDTARIEGYANAIPEDFTTTIETYSDIAAKIAEDGIRVPAGLTPVAMVKYTLRDGTGAIAEPSNNFWISIKVPEGVDMADIGIYRVFLDGSLVKLTDAIEPNRFITANTFFSMDTFLVLSGVYSSKKAVVEDNTEEDTTESEIISDLGNGETQQVIKTPTRVVRRKKLIKKKNVAANDFTWLWIIIIIVAVVVVIATGLIVFFIIRKKRKNGKGNIA